MKPYRVHGEHSGPPFGLYRDPETAVIFGICSGLANRLGINPWGLRVLALIALVFFTAATVTAYLLSALLLPRRRLLWRGRQSERDFWRAAAREASD
ncbi:phage shock protein PspC (stress-responsive transcriptional regulator) [Natronospira proteinivora]|uniref:Phage shock protein PspC (Stress-responsive transcriptional regulator) n=1 Tax=Natronospira proteinivora TaxID=1807133 RepID=A0ABT1GAJ8_9GAMM|nr:PspC domain-containing protein [Natronospira proteinivora]MCP1728296.1 phage shock protein PspC (stress-responsive transcriptional regulator) [Natronospira proteinivora]